MPLFIGTTMAFTGGLLPTHERWFVESAATDVSYYFRVLPLALTMVALLLTVAWRTAAKMIEGPELRILAPLGKLVPWVPRLLGIHLGVSLLALAAVGAFLTPAVKPDGVFGDLLLLVEAGLGVWLVSGVRLAVPAAGVLVLGPALSFLAGPTALLECANLAAVAAFLVLVPPSAVRHGAVDVNTVRLRWALLTMRVGVGVALIALAFTEKFMNPAMAGETLRQYPELNVLATIGVPVSDATFIVIAGTVELLFGLLVLSGAAPQVAVLVAAVPFNATLILFGQTELVGHLPVYGVFLALLVYGSNVDTYRLVRWLPAAPGRVSVTTPATEAACSRCVAGEPRPVREGWSPRVGSWRARDGPNQTLPLRAVRRGSNRVVSAQSTSGGATRPAGRTLAATTEAANWRARIVPQGIGY